MSSRTVLVETEDDGSFVYEREFVGEILALSVALGTLTEGFALDVLDPENGVAIFSGSVFVSGTYAPLSIATDEIGKLTAGPFAMGMLRVEISEAGDSKSGSVRILHKT